MLVLSSALSRLVSACREDEPSFHPQVSCVIAFVSLAPSVLVERANSQLRQRDRLATLGRLDIHELQPAIGAIQGALDPNRAASRDRCRPTSNSAPRLAAGRARGRLYTTLQDGRPLAPPAVLAPQAGRTVESRDAAHWAGSTSGAGLRVISPTSRLGRELCPARVECRAQSTGES
jgi:hypothetical protein